jgi:7-cyano-7-deazaguanine synthase
MKTLLSAQSEGQTAEMQREQTTMTTNPCIPDPHLPVAVLVSGGLDSAILLAESLVRHPAVHPLYVRFGLAWEAVELQHLSRFLEVIAAPSLHPLVVLDQPLRDLYGSHWSISGEDVPGADTPDEAVFLPGRNVFLLAKSVLWCHLHRVPALALAPLKSNPFPDATAEFFAALEEVLNRAINGRVRLFQPYSGRHKVDVLRCGNSLPLKHTFSCIRPMMVNGDGRHCGTCNKCAERQRAFSDAGLPDPTPYYAPTDARDQCSL